MEITSPFAIGIKLSRGNLGNKKSKANFIYVLFPSQLMVSDVPTCLFELTCLIKTTLYALYMSTRNSSH